MQNTRNGLRVGVARTKKNLIKWKNRELPLWLCEHGNLLDEKHLLECNDGDPMRMNGSFFQPK